jgi:2,3-diketo-5-methylthio-1-phosphopentane phosphatase
MQDTGHVLVSNLGGGDDFLKKIQEQIKTGERSFREASEDMWGSLTIPIEDGFDTMRNNMSMDPKFKEFHEFCMENNISFNVISAGLRPILRKVLDAFLGAQESSNINIVANDADIDGSTPWKPIWLHETELGHDKALSVNQGRAEAAKACVEGEIPLVIFIGDGVSDLTAAREADILFARKGLKLEEYCNQNQIPYIPFETFADIKQEVQHIMKEDLEKTGGTGIPARFNPRANMWRRISSKQAVPKFAAATPSNEEKMFLWPEAFSNYQPKAVPQDGSV